MVVLLMGQINGLSKGSNQRRFTQEGCLLSDFHDAKQLGIVQWSSTMSTYQENENTKLTM